MSSETIVQVGEPKHPDFVKIWKQFLKHYCGSADTECKVGKAAYYTWLNKMGLDDTRAYGEQMEKLKKVKNEAFRWAKPRFKVWKTARYEKYYKVEACFPLSSMNRNVYTEFELERATRTLIGQDVNLNHEWAALKGVSIHDAEYEDGAAELILRVTNQAGRLRGINIQSMIEKEEILQVSIEAYCLRGFEPTPTGTICKGLKFSGLALLTKDVLPGIPLTRIMPVEAILESALPMVKKEAVKVIEVKKLKKEGKNPVEKSEAHIVDVTPEPCDHEKEIVDLKLELSELKRRNRSLHEKVKALEAKIRQRDKEIKAKKDRVSGLEKQEEKLVDVKLEVSELKRTKKAVEDKFEDLKAKLKQKESEVSVKDDRITDLQKISQEVADLKLQVSEFKRGKRGLTEKIKSLEAVIAAKDEEVLAKEERINEVEHDLTEEEKKCEDAKSRLSELRELHKSVASQLVDLTGENVKLDKKAELLELERDQCTSQLETLRVKFEDCSQKRFDTAQKNMDLTQKLTSRNDEILKLKEDIELVRAELRKAKRFAKRINKIDVKL